MEELEGGLTLVEGIKVSSLNCGLKNDRKDLALIFSEKLTVASGVFTKNQFAAPSVTLAKERLKINGKLQTIIINSGNANTCTGPIGEQDNKDIIKEVASKLGIDAEYVLMASTGVIGRRLPVDKIKKAIPELVVNLGADSIELAKAIMTTDTFPKQKAVKFNFNGRDIVVAGVAKGSGMIYPNMATMLCFIVTNISINYKCLTDCLKKSVDKTFNMISVDGDTSPNDMVIAMANGTSGNEMINDASVKDNLLLQEFQKALDKVTRDLATMIVKDGEGATKLIEITVNKAKNFEEAKKIAFTVANSNLVKTAMFGNDPNWGRIVSAIGNAGINLDTNKVKVYINDNLVFGEGIGVVESFEKLRTIFGNNEIFIYIDIGVGEGQATVWSSDLSYEYVRINADYTT
ncbi:MAG: bifunctional glutamate N-acetyltransferase/amino-acid acetyltransferase ArgJ [bacterium]